MGYFSKQVSRVRAFIKRAFAEQATPPKVGFAIALGVLVGTSPLVGFHSFVAIGLASVTRLNRMLTFLGTNISFGPLLGLFITGELVLGSRLLGRPAPSLSLEHAAQEATSAVGSWWLGWAVIGPATALLAGLAGFWMARAKLRREQAAGVLIEAPPSASSLALGDCSSRAATT